MPAGIKSIHQTFSGTDIQSITVPQSVTEIEDNAFEKCFSLTEITMNDGITAIGSQAFYECTALKKITIPSSVRSIGKDAFEAMDCLEKFTNNSSVTCILPTHRSGGRKLLQTFYLNKKAVSQVEKGSTVQAKWKSFRVTLKAGKGKITGKTVKTHTYGTSEKLPTAKRKGYPFFGWDQKDDSFGKSWSCNTIASYIEKDTVFSAIYKKTLIKAKKE